MFWYLVIIGVCLGLLLVPLGRRWCMGVGFAVLGAVSSAGITFAGGWYYLKHYVPKHHHTNDMDFGGWEWPLLLLVIIPVLSTFVGLVAGLCCAYWLETLLSDE